MQPTSLVDFCLISFPLRNHARIMAAPPRPETTCLASQVRSGGYVTGGSPDDLAWTPQRMGIQEQGVNPADEPQTLLSWRQNEGQSITLKTPRRIQAVCGARGPRRAKTAAHSLCGFGPLSQPPRCAVFSRLPQRRTWIQNHSDRTDERTPCPY